MPSSLQALQQLHRTYSGLQAELLEVLSKALQAEVDPADNASVLRRRALLKLVTDLHIVGVLDALSVLQPPVIQLVRSFAASDCLEGRRGRAVLFAEQLVLR